MAQQTTFLTTTKKINVSSTKVFQVLTDAELVACPCGANNKEDGNASRDKNVSQLTSGFS